MPRSSCAVEIRSFVEPDQYRRGMTPQDAAAENGADAEDATADVETGRRGQRLICEGWFASHADSGTPGPHIHLRTSDGHDPVLRTDQVPNFVEALTVVAERIDRVWTVQGDDYAANVVLRSPDPQDREVIRQTHIDHLRFAQRVADNLPEVTRLLAQAESTDEALVNIGALLGVEEAEVMHRSHASTCSVSPVRAMSDDDCNCLTSPKCDEPTPARRTNMPRTAKEQSCRLADDARRWHWTRQSVPRASLSPRLSQ